MPTGITPPVAGERITVVMMSAYIAKSPRCTGKIVRVIFLQIDLYQRQTATMSALGHKRTFAVQNGMSAVTPKADMCSARAHVRFVPIADILKFEIRFSRAPPIVFPQRRSRALSCQRECSRRTRQVPSLLPRDDRARRSAARVRYPP